MSYTYPSGGNPPQAAPTNSTAVISLIMGILGLTFLPLVGSIIALITGPMARREIQASGGAQSGEGLATAGIVLGWVGIGLSVIGVCVVGAFVGIPFCIAILGLATNQGHSFILPAISALI